MSEENVLAYSVFECITQWTDNAMDIFIAAMKSVNRQRPNYPTARAFLEEVRRRMIMNGVNIEVAEIQKIWLQLRQMYLSRDIHEELVEAELCKIFKEFSAMDSPDQILLVTKQQIEASAVAALSAAAIAASTADAQETVSTWQIEDCSDPCFWSARAKDDLKQVLKLYKSNFGTSLQNKRMIWQTITEELANMGYNYTVQEVSSKSKSILKFSNYLPPEPFTGEPFESCEIDFEVPFAELIEADNQKFMNDALTEYDCSGMPFGYRSFAGDEFVVADTAPLDNDDIGCRDYKTIVIHPPTSSTGNNENDINLKVEYNQPLPGEYPSAYDKLTESGELMCVTENAFTISSQRDPDTVYSKGSVERDVKSASPKTKIIRKKSLNDGSKLVAHEISAYRRASMQLEQQKIALTRQQLHAYRDRTVEIAANRRSTLKLEQKKLVAYKERTGEIEKVGHGLARIVRNISRTK